MPASRQLAAIMFTDIEGYTAIMQKNEETAIKTRKKHRTIFNAVTEKHNGRILQYYGDGTLSIFKSAIEAVQCAIEMQLGFLEDPAIPVRIGIHTGDVVFMDDEIIGDGINVASRIEALAVPGSILISDKVYDEIKNQESISTSYLSAFKLKNVEKPVAVYSISNEGLIVAKPEDLVKEIEAETSWLSKKADRKKKNILRKNGVFITLIILAGLIWVYLKFGLPTASTTETNEKSIAVLAFENMSGDPNQEYFSDGISEEILNSLSNINGLKVAGRTSSFSFKGKNEDIRAIGKKLQVKMILEGSVRKEENKVRITAQLTNTDDGYHLWSETYDREMQNIFAIQDEIATRIAEKLKLQFQDSKGKSFQTNSMKAYDLLLKGIYFLKKDFEGTEKALEYFEQAVELDSAYATAYARIGDAYLDFAAYRLLPSAEAYSRARTAAEKAISLNERENLAHNVLAYVHLYHDWDWDAALLEYNKAIQHGYYDPNHFITFYDILLNQDYEHAIHVSKILLEIEPLDIQSHWHLGFCYFSAGRFEDALSSFENALELDPNYSEGHRWKGLTLSAKHNYKEAIESLEKALEITQGEGPANIDLLCMKILTGKEKEVVPILNQMIRSEEYVDPIGPAMLYTQLGDKDLALDWLEKAYQEKSLYIITIKVWNFWDPLRKEPRFMEIYRKMNFPDN